MTLQRDLAAGVSRESNVQVTPSGEFAAHLRLLQVTTVPEKPIQPKTLGSDVLPSPRDSAPSGWGEEVLIARYLAMISACASFLVGLFRMLYDKWKVANWIERPHTSLMHRMDEIATLAAKEGYYHHQRNGSWKGRLWSYRDTKKKGLVRQKDRGHNLNNHEPCELARGVRSQNGQDMEHGSGGPSTTNSMPPRIASVDAENDCGRVDSGLQPAGVAGHVTPRGGVDKKIKAKDEWRRAGDRFYAFLASGLNRVKGYLWKRE